MRLYPLTLYPQNYSIGIFTHLKLCLADAIHNFKWVKIIQIWQNRGQRFSNIVDWCHILSLTYLKCGTYALIKNENPNICGTGGLRVKALRYVRTSTKFFQFEVAINVLVNSFRFRGLFEYLCYGYTAIINISTLTVRGSKSIPAL